jgi:hypothetical protein
MIREDDSLMSTTILLTIWPRAMLVRKAGAKERFAAAPGQVFLAFLLLP